MHVPTEPTSPRARDASRASRAQLARGILREEAILWLWQRHNSVNIRLAAEQRAAAAAGAPVDVSHPKELFPSPRACGACLDETRTQWIVPSVLGFLAETYCSRESSDGHFRCARERASAVVAGPAIEPRGDSWQAPALALVFCALCCLLAGMPWLCRSRCERLSLELEALEDRKVGAQLDREAAADEAAAAAEAAEAAAEEKEAAAAGVGARTPEQPRWAPVSGGAGAPAIAGAGAGVRPGGYARLPEQPGTEMWS